VAWAEQAVVVGFLWVDVLAFGLVPVLHGEVVLFGVAVAEGEQVQLGGHVHVRRCLVDRPVRCRGRLVPE
jgi:hypothetical protein